MTGKDDVGRPGTYNVLKLEGKYEITQRRAGEIIHFQKGKNLITGAGENLTAELLDFEAAGAAPEYIAFGSGTAAALKADTQLQTEIASTRTQSDGSTRTTNTMLLAFQFTGAGSIVVYEMGIFNDAVAGTMMSRFLVQQLSIDASDLVDITWAITISGVD